MKRMKSMYVRQVAILLGLTFLCMVLLGVGFFTLSYRYQLQEIQNTGPKRRLYLQLRRRRPDQGREPHG